MRIDRWNRVLAVSSLLFLIACPPDGGDDAGTDAGTADSGVADAGRDSGADASARDATGRDAALSDGPRDERGFTIQEPQEHALECDGPTGTSTETFTDVGYVCDLRYGDVDAYVYVHAVPTSTLALMACIPETYDTLGWISVGGAVSEVTASYDYGGNHANDFFQVSYRSRVYKYYHSSFGVGWRACKPPDCIQVYESGALLEDGCTSARSIPAICVEVQSDGSVPELVDSFETCPGDPNVDAG